MNRRMSGQSLLLLELTLAGLIFLLSAAVCAGLFTRSIRISEQSAATTGAVFAAENAAEVFKATGDMEELARLLSGSVQGDSVVVTYDTDWKPAPGGAFTLTLTQQADGTGDLSQANIAVRHAKQGDLFELAAVRNGGAS